MSNKLNEKPTSTTQPSTFIAIIDGAVKQLTWAGFTALISTTWARLNSPALTGTPTAPTRVGGDNSNNIATTAYADSAVSTLSASVISALAAKAPLASPALSGNPTAPTQAAGDNSTRLATTAYADGAVSTLNTSVTSALSAKAPLASPALTGNPTAPTQAPGNNSTRLATTAYADAAAAAAAASVVNSAPGTLDTLKELADALGDDANYAASISTALGGKVPTSRTVTGAGLATGGGALSANQTITVPVASQAQAEAGTDNATAMTPLRTTQLVPALIHAATSKATPVDADEVGATDSAVSFGFKKWTWANIKATLKTYFDSLYAALTHASRHKSGGADAIKLDELAAPTDVTTLDATTGAHGLMSKADKIKLNGVAANANNYTLPAPTETVLGGVKRNAGSSGQYVKGIDSTGALQFDTPAGGGGGGKMVFGYGILQGNTTAYQAGSQGASQLDLASWDLVSEGTINITTSQGSVTFFLGAADPGDGTVFIDLAIYTVLSEVQNFIFNYCAGPLASMAITLSGSIIAAIDNYNAGSGSYANMTGSLPGVAFNGLGSGTDEVPASGAVTGIQVITCQSGKSLLPVRIGWHMDTPISGATIRFALISDNGAYLYQIATPVDGSTYTNLEVSNLNNGFAQIESNWNYWLIPPGTDYHLWVYFDESPPDGGSITVWAQGWQF